MTEIKHCETCKHWGKPGEGGEDFRTCTAVVHDKRGLVNEWRSDQLDDDGYDPEEKAEILGFRSTHSAIVQDGSGYYAALKPRRDFGCVLHEPRPDGEPS